MSAAELGAAGVDAGGAELGAVAVDASGAQGLAASDVGGVQAALAGLRIGLGYDVHALVEGRPLIIGGVEKTGLTWYRMINGTPTKILWARPGCCWAASSTASDTPPSAVHRIARTSAAWKR